jgi:hypothetical protein
MFIRNKLTSLKLIKLSRLKLREPSPHKGRVEEPYPITY